MTLACLGLKATVIGEGQLLGWVLTSGHNGRFPLSVVLVVQLEHYVCLCVCVCVWYCSVCVSWVLVAGQSWITDDMRACPLRLPWHAGGIRLRQNLQEWAVSLRLFLLTTLVVHIEQLIHCVRVWTMTFELNELWNKFWCTCNFLSACIMRNFRIIHCSVDAWKNYD